MLKSFLRSSLLRHSRASGNDRMVQNLGLYEFVNFGLNKEAEPFWVLSHLSSLSKLLFFPSDS